MLRPSVMRIMILALALAAWPVPAWCQPLLIGVRVDPPQFQPDGSGMVDRFLKESFARAGLEARLVTLPSERSLFDADAGIIDGDGNRVEGLEKLYPNLVRVPESTNTWEFTAFTLDSGPRVTNWDDLAGHSVGHIIGWKIVEQHLKGFKATGAVASRELFRLLLSGRVEVVVYQRQGGALQLKELGVPQGMVRSVLLERREMFCYLNRRHAGLVPRLAVAMRELKRDGTRERLFGIGD